MAVTNFSPLLGLALPTTGDLSGIWGTTVNDSITNLLDSAVAGTTTLSADADVTLSTINGSANQARNAVLLCTGARTTARTITAPAQSKAYIVINSTTGGYAVNLVGSGPTTGVSIVAGEKALVAWNGSDFVKISSTAIVSSINFGSTGLTPAAATYGAVTVAGTLSVANGGTGLTSPSTAGSILVSTGTSWSPTLPIAVGSGGTGTTSLSGVLKGQGGSSIISATAGTDYVAPSTATTFTATQTFNGSTSVYAAKLINAVENVSVSSAAAGGTINYDLTTQSVVYYTSNATANWTINFRASATTPMSSALSVGDSITAVFIATQGLTPYYNTTVQVDGVTIIPKYQGGIPWTSGNVASLDAYSYTIVRTGGSYTIFASQTRFV
jgi:hypothetical protein